MKMKITAMLAGLATAIGFAPSAWAFHEGGVAYCDGCHSMHNSNGNKSMSGGRNTSLAGWGNQAVKDAATKSPYTTGWTPTYSASTVSKAQFTGNAYLLQGSDDSSTCLNCHAANDAAPSGYHIMTFPSPAAGAAPVERTPAGDFAWLKIASAPGTLATYGAPVSDKGERHGHNIVAADYGLVADTTLLTAPGGNFPASSLSCASCHDPHSRARIEDTATGAITMSKFGSAVKPIAGSGSYGAASTATEAVGVYRLLASSNYSQMSVPGVLAFNADPPVAVAPASYNQSEATNEVRVAYGQGMSEWCANCHRSIHNDTVNTANTAFIHPAGNNAKLSATANDLAGAANGTTIANIYNAYVKSGDLTGSATTSYTSLVPFERGTGVIATLAGLADNTNTVAAAKAGPAGTTENVMCLSCHRAHASGFLSMARWNNNGEFITIDGAYPGSDAPTTEGQGGQYSRGYTTAQYAAAMYDRPATTFAVAQRSLCNKCHAKD